MKTPKILKKLFGKSVKREKTRSYDAAAENRHNQKHWIDADGSDADSAISADLPTLRNRTRSEIRNNSYAKGIVDTFANDVIGPGPTLQYIPEVEEKWALWAKNSDMGGKLGWADGLKLDIVQLLESGEAVITLTGQPFLGQTFATHIDGVQEKVPGLKTLRIEPDRVASPWKFFGDPNVRDGIRVDDFGKPLQYYILKRHPGDSHDFTAIDEYSEINAENVIHLYRQDRPGQSRGVPWLSPSLPLFAQLRRYTLAVLAAAETGADFSAVLESIADDLEPTAVAELDTFEIERNSMVTMPKGWRMNQFKAEQPTTSYKDFKHEIINEICRCINMPLNVGLGNSAGYNYASGRLDWQVYYQTIAVIRAWIGRIVCDRIFSAWLREGLSISGFFSPKTIGAIHNNKTKVEWLWIGRKHVDPKKEADAANVRIGSGVTTLVDEWVAEGKDPDIQKIKLIDEVDWFRKNGLVHPLDKPSPEPVVEPEPEPVNAEGDEDDEDEK